MQLEADCAKGIYQPPAKRGFTGRGMMGAQLKQHDYVLVAKLREILPHAIGQKEPSLGLKFQSISSILLLHRLRCAWDLFRAPLEASLPKPAELCPLAAHLGEIRNKNPKTSILICGWA